MLMGVTRLIRRKEPASSRQDDTKVCSFPLHLMRQLWYKRAKNTGRHKPISLPAIGPLIINQEFSDWFYCISIYCAFY